MINLLLRNISPNPQWNSVKLSSDPYPTWRERTQSPEDGMLRAELIVKSIKFAKSAVLCKL